MHLAALWFLVNVVGRVPSQVLFPLAYLGGTLAWHLSSPLQRVTRDHMRHVLGPRARDRDVDRAARACARAAAQGYAAFAHLPHLSPARVHASVIAFDGLDMLLAARDAGQGAVLISAHLGAAEVLTHAAPAFGLDFAVIAEPLRPRRVHDFVQSVRAVPGVRFITADLAGLREARAHLAAGGMLGLLVDRDVLGTGRPFAFFGERALMPTGAVELARRTGVPIIAIWVLREGASRYRLLAERVTLPPATGDRAADVDSGMRALIAALEGGIRRAPGQWTALVPVWSGLAADREASARFGTRFDNTGPYNEGDGERTELHGR